MGKFSHFRYSRNGPRKEEEKIRKRKRKYKEKTYIFMNPLKKGEGESILRRPIESGEFRRGERRSWICREVCQGNN